MQKVVAIAPNSSSVRREEKGPVKVYDSLYLGSRLDARNVKKLKALGITAVVDCAPEYKAIDAKQTKQCFAESFAKQCLKLDLHDDERILTEFRTHAEKAIDFINKHCDKNQKVLVYCHLGTSRAAGIVLAYIMRKEDIDYSVALGQLRNLCAGTDQVILPNRWIEDLLAMWE